jgi:ribosomal protein L31E
MHKCQYPLNGLLNAARRTSEVSFEFKERYKAIECQVRKDLSRTIFERTATKIPEKIKLVGFVSRAQLCHEERSAHLRIFLCRKKNGLIKPKMFYIMFDYYNLNYAQTQPRPKLYLCYQGWAHAHH